MTKELLKLLYTHTEDGPLQQRCLTPGPRTGTSLRVMSWYRAAQKEEITYMTSILFII